MISICSDVRRLDERPPFFDLVSLKGAKGLGGLLLVCGQFKPKVREALSRSRQSRSTQRLAMVLFLWFPTLQDLSPDNLRNC
jgi:hypothetical protein